ncbi:MAG: nicotinate (nicotinamide) nucleotide adenylyltransferase [Nitrospirae bacterium]|nr:nicotinate (nicotinamide) nucleotide adenylyltransferase [Nitrospirota bacterium]
MKIGLFGGTFNPIHRCHLTIARQVRDRLALDSILFIPTGTPPHKQLKSLAPAHHRLAMVREAIAEEPTFSATDLEVHRASPSYSIDTVRALQQKYGQGVELFFLIGLDAFLDIPTWKQAPDLLRTCHFVVIGRPGSQFIRLATLTLLPHISDESLRALDAGTVDRVDVPIEATAHLILLALAPCPVSASDVRSRLRRGLNLGDVLPVQVESYIMRFGLYKEAADLA